MPLGIRPQAYANWQRVRRGLVVHDGLEARENLGLRELRAVRMENVKLVKVVATEQGRCGEATSRKGEQAAATCGCGRTAAYRSTMMCRASGQDSRTSLLLVGMRVEANRRLYWLMSSGYAAHRTHPAGTFWPFRWPRQSNEAPYATRRTAHQIGTVEGERRRHEANEVVERRRVGLFRLGVEDVGQ